jgi:hypothetical protein
VEVEQYELAVTTGQHGCPRCPARWNGYNTGHCSACHETFTGITAFDKHRDGSHVKGRYCVSPQSVGLVPAGRAYPCWALPGTYEREEE